MGSACLGASFCRRDANGAASPKPKAAKGFAVPKKPSKISLPFWRYV